MRTGPTCTPRTRRVRPPRSRFTVALGTASAVRGPITIALMPITSPRALTSGPPELPGRSSMSARMASWKCRLPRSSIVPTPLKIPSVTAPGTPSGWPTAITSSPGRSAPESPTGNAASPLASTWMIARSRSGRLATTRPSCVAPRFVPSLTVIRARSPGTT
ncbi:MAG: hypothetical protein AVDCRST_MAG88-141 [uncultured Thermomicrobiales bacterium]|uniref:Uncharacterized protein n=1 Tax=uncultured Thermomicrobiales bacterium TaxID=1645740 RepID=A0A6J4U7G4_9BACT|nr:MAG: hypothetical protein AVDCRST_MAG88-141 [uncultured Thermomicrobiales bacterium]